MPVQYLETRSLDPFYNLAFEEYILCNRQEGDYLLLWQNDNVVVIGQNQNAEAEVNRSFAEAYQISVVRRATGGGAVYHDLGNLNYSFITDTGNAEELTMERFVSPVVAALKKLGLQAEASGRNDILIEGRKVSGTAQRIVKGRILHHGTLLFDSDLSKAAGVLNVDPEKFRSKSAVSVRSRIGNIREFLKEDMTLPEFWTYLKKELAGNGLMMVQLSDRELKLIENCRHIKYDTWEWNFGKSPQYTMANKKYWDGGCLEIQAAVNDGKITEMVFYGDFMCRCPMTELTSSIKGCPFRWDSVAEILSRFPLKELFGAITEEEILKTIFNMGET